MHPNIDTEFQQLQLTSQEQSCITNIRTYFSFCLHCIILKQISDINHFIHPQIQFCMFLKQNENKI